MAKTVHQVMLIFTKTVIEDGKVLAQVEANSMLKEVYHVSVVGHVVIGLTILIRCC